MKKILLLDDSALMRRIFCDIIESDNRFVIADTASNGIEGLKLLEKNQYDLILSDLMMPQMDGIEFLKELEKRQCEIPVVIISTVAKEGAAITIEALSLGAVDFIKKPKSITELQSDKFQSLFFKVISGAFPEHISKMHEKKEKEKQLAQFFAHNRTRKTLDIATASKVVAIASSTGGPKALMEVVPFLPANLDAPVLIVQHMPSGFTDSLAKRIDGASNLQAHEAADGMKIEKGHVYIAKGGLHMSVFERHGENIIRLFDGETREGVKPCANYMYESLSNSSYQHVQCVVLTGMGADGTEGITNLKKDKSVHVIAQSKDTCAVYGMPRCVDLAGLTDESVPLKEVAEAIIKNVGVIKDGR